MKRKTFNQWVVPFLESDINSDLAWTTYLNCIKLLKNSNQETIQYLTQMGLMSNKEKLKWRTKLAEKGIELTPDQIEDYILLLSLAIHVSLVE